MIYNLKLHSCNHNIYVHTFSVSLKYELTVFIYKVFNLFINKHLFSLHDNGADQSH